MLTEKLLKGDEPTCHLVLVACKRADEPTFRHVTPQKIAIILRRYGLTSRKGNDGRRLRRDLLPHVERIERSYGIDLRTPERGHLGIVATRRY